MRTRSPTTVPNVPNWGVPLQRRISLEVEDGQDETTAFIQPTNGPIDCTGIKLQRSLETKLENKNRTSHRYICFRFCQSTKVAHCPIDRYTLIYDSNHDAHLEVVLVPEAFRMWFYYGWWIFLFFSAIVSLLWATDMNLTDNMFLDRFNGNNPCIFFDYPPFSYMGAILWMPQIFNLVTYEILDLFRVYDNYYDNMGQQIILLSFCRCYTACTIFECLSFIAFVQTLATSPEENLAVHSIPFFVMTVAFWTMAFKKFLYLKETGKLDNAVSNGKRCTNLKVIGGWIYVIAMLLALIGKFSTVLPNWGGARLWERWYWTSYVQRYCTYSWFILTLLVPILIYWIITENLDKVKFVINRVPVAVI